MYYFMLYLHLHINCTAFDPLICNIILFNYTLFKQILYVFILQKKKFAKKIHEFMNP